MLYNKQIFKRCFSFPARYWYKNLKYIPLYFNQIHFLMKHGYDEYATWETFDWFITTMRSVLTRYRNTHFGTPWKFIVENTEGGDEVWNNVIDKMVALLDDMDEYNEKYAHMDHEEIFKQQEDAKDEFFTLFSKYFYYLWD